MMRINAVDMYSAGGFTRNALGVSLTGVRFPVMVQPELLADTPFPISLCKLPRDARSAHDFDTLVRLFGFTGFYYP